MLGFCHKRIKYCQWSAILLWTRQHSALYSKYPTASKGPCPQTAPKIPHSFWKLLPQSQTSLLKAPSKSNKELPLSRQFSKTTLNHREIHKHSAIVTYKRRAGTSSRFLKGLVSEVDRHIPLCSHSKAEETIFVLRPMPRTISWEKSLWLNYRIDILGRFGHGIMSVEYFNAYLFAISVCLPQVLPWRIELLHKISPHFFASISVSSIRCPSLRGNR